MNKILLLLFISMLLASCASMTPGGIDIITSDYDGSKELHLTPGHANSSWGGGNIKIGALKTTKMKKEDVILIVRNDAIKNFKLRGDSFFLNIDGKEHRFSSVSKMSCKTGGAGGVANCSRAYMSNMKVIEKIISAKSVKYKLLFQDDSYVAGTMNLSRMPTLAFPALINFKKEAKKNNMY